jgi:tRNA nucleotidyltransferase (CCA-adding enzyme)
MVDNARLELGRKNEAINPGQRFFPRQGCSLSVACYFCLRSLERTGLSYTDCLPSVSEVSSALSPRTWPFSLEWLPPSACLVGGTVRDALLGRQGEYLDLDFVLPQGAVETAQAIARHYKAGYVLLDAERQIARVVFEQGTADFAQQIGATLNADLKRRDFTVNAIAYNPHTDQLIDPLQGYADLQKRLLRMVAAENLEEDPLRLLRAFRQAAQLGFAVEDHTRDVIRQLAPLLQRIAAERVQSEINYLLGTARGTFWLTAAWQDGLLKAWFPDASLHSMEWIAGIDQAFVRFQEVLPEFATELCDRIRSTSRNNRPGSGGNRSNRGGTAPEHADLKASGSARTWLSAAKLASLLPFDSGEAETQLRRLKYSRTEIQAVSTILKYLPQFCSAVGMDILCLGHGSPLPPSLSLSLREQYEFFQGVGVTFPAVAVLAIAHGIPQEVMAPLIHRYLNPDDLVAHPSPLLSGQNLMTALNLSAGPQIGQLLAAIQLARAEGKISTVEEALDLAVKCIERGSSDDIE